MENGRENCSPWAHILWRGSLLPKLGRKSGEKVGLRWEITHLSLSPLHIGFLFLFLFRSRDMWVNLYRHHFLFSHFSSQPTKDFSTPNQTHEGKLKSFMFSHFSIPTIFYSSHFFSFKPNGPLGKKYYFLVNVVLCHLIWVLYFVSKFQAYFRDEAWNV